MRNNKLKIVISSYDSPENPYYGGGGAIAVVEVAKHLSLYFDVTIVFGSYPGSMNATVDGVHYRYINTIHLGPKINQLLFSAILPLYSIFIPFDVWLESFTPPFGGSLLPILTHKPVIGLVHMLVGPDMKRKYRLPFDLIERICIRFYSNIIATSERFQHIIQDASPKTRVVVISNGVNFPKSPADLRKPKSIVYLGRIEVNQKGLDLLLGAYKQLNTQLPLSIAGTGTPEEITALHRQVQRYGLASRIRLLGKISGQKKHTLLTHAACVVVPSRYETFSLTALEALAYGIPLVTFSIPGLEWIPVNAKLSAKNFNIHQLATCITVAIQNVSIRQKLQKAGRAFARRKGWSVVGDHYYQFIQKII